MTTREYLIDVAASKLGDYVKGSREVEAIWRDVLPESWTDQQVKSYAKTKDWCGGLVLKCLREAKLTEVHWQDGSGFVIPLLGYASVTKTPKPGDIGIRVGPKWHEVYHHFLVVTWDSPHGWGSIDGNAPTCVRRHHTSLDPTIVFYSIEKLLPAIPEAGFSSDSPFAVPGVQEKP